MKTVSPFEFAITQIADPEKAKTMRPETEDERKQRIIIKAKDFAGKIKIRKP